MELGGVKCQPFLKHSGYYVADASNSHHTFMRLSVFTQGDERIQQWTKMKGGG